MTWKNKIRQQALKNFDQLLQWCISEKFKAVALLDPPIEEAFAIDIPEVKDFAESCGYFSAQRPIVGKVSADVEDVKHVCCVLKAMYERGEESNYLQIAIAEVLSKALAYRDLKIGQQIQIPHSVGTQVYLETFTVDRVFDLWHRMPAFGLIPARQGLESILLFRGTDFSLTSQRGWASLLSDIDRTSPGLSAFRRAQEKIHPWLMDRSEKASPARVMGFSLGGTLAAYTFIYENAAIAKDGSFAFCPLGVAEKVVKDWELLSLERQRGFTTYINKGDLVSKAGRLFGTVYALSLKKPLKPLYAHTALMTAEHLVLKAQVDVQKENARR